MPVIQAKSAGFCYGVRRAVELAEKTARETGGCVMLGSIIHNANVVARLEQLGARQVDSPDAVRPRGHGDHPLPRGDPAGAGAAGGHGGPVRQRHLSQRSAHPAYRVPGRSGRAHSPGHRRAPSPGGHGAASWWDGTLVFPGPEELERWLLEDPARRDLPLTAVARPPASGASGKVQKKF